MSKTYACQFVHIFNISSSSQFIMKDSDLTTKIINAIKIGHG